jgi:succinate-semialdehyde dehydrogenase/glutarate-semialdehyde dehydrogenase
MLKQRTAPSGLLIAGDERPSADGGTFPVLDPADGSAIAEVADGTVADGLRAVEAAAAAGRGWASTPPRVRSEALRATFEAMRDRRDELAELIVRENGKPLSDALGEIDYAAEFFRWYAEEAVRITGTAATAPAGGNRILVLHQPVGVCVLVTPWNFPAAMAARKIAPALAAGCSVVLKPASDTPLSALLLASLLEKAGVGPGVVNVVPSRHSGPVVAAMVDHPAVRKLSFTGSTEVGRRLLELAARTVVNTSMELGGNAPFIVFADADLDAAVDGALLAKMRNVGEACTAANRFYVERPLVDAFAERLAVRMRGLRIGRGLEEGVAVGPLINDEARGRIDHLVGDATARGAEIATGGRRVDGPGFFYHPTVLTGVDADADILREEIFGPVAPIVAFDERDDVIARANDTEHGLVAYVYTADLARGLAVGEALEAGMVALNRGLVSDPAAPFGGVKQSGIGREGGHEGVLDYTESKYFAVAEPFVGS